MNTSLRCCACRKALLWEFTKRARGVKGSGYTGWRRRHALLRKEKAKIAIRCLWCFHTFCPRCARKHFAPIRKAQIAVDTRLAKAASTALDIVLSGHLIGASVVAKKKP
jgi:hypothetical protein